MLSLYYRFENVVTVAENRTLEIPFGTLRLDSSRSLCLDTRSGASCGMGDDVYAFASDGLGAWHIKYRDYFNGMPWVYGVLFSDFETVLKGVIDRNGAFLYLNDGILYKMDKSGQIEAVCSIDAVSGFLEFDNENMPLTLNRVANCLASSCNVQTDGNVYGDMVMLHRLVGQVSQDGSLNSVSKPVLAQIVVEAMTVAAKAEMNLQAEIAKIIKSRLKGGDTL